MDKIKAQDVRILDFMLDKIGRKGGVIQDHDLVNAGLISKENSEKRFMYYAKILEDNKCCQMIKLGPFESFPIQWGDRTLQVIDEGGFSAIYSQQQEEKRKHEDMFTLQISSLKSGMANDKTARRVGWAGVIIALLSIAATLLISLLQKA